MKRFSIAALMLSLISLSSFANIESNSKETMEKRVDKLIDDVRESRNLFQKNEAKNACDKVPAIVETYKAHLMDSGVKLELNRTRSHKVIHWAYEQLIYFHKLQVVCEMGKDQEYVQMDDTIDDLKNIIKSLKKQGRKIHRSEAESHNSFRYNYHTQVNPSR